MGIRSIGTMMGFGGPWTKEKLNILEGLSSDNQGERLATIKMSE